MTLSRDNTLLLRRLLQGVDPGVAAEIERSLHRCGRGLSAFQVTEIVALALRLAGAAT